MLWHCPPESGCLATASQRCSSRNRPATSGQHFTPPDREPLAERPPPSPSSRDPPACCGAACAVFWRTHLIPQPCWRSPSPHGVAPQQLDVPQARTAPVPCTGVCSGGSGGHPQVRFVAPLLPPAARPRVHLAIMLTWTRFAHTVRNAVGRRRGKRAPLAWSGRQPGLPGARRPVEPICDGMLWPIHRFRVQNNAVDGAKDGGAVARKLPAALPGGDGKAPFVACDTAHHAEMVRTAGACQSCI